MRANAIALLAVMVSAHTAGAQQRPASGAPLATRLGSVERGREIRVISAGRRTEAAFDGVDAERLILTRWTTQGDRAAKRLVDMVPIAHVDTVWQRHRGTRRGAMIGLVTGAVATQIAASRVRIDVCARGECVGDNGALNYVVVGTGALLGAVIGALAGSPFHFWKRIYP